MFVIIIKPFLKSSKSLNEFFKFVDYILLNGFKRIGDRCSKTVGILLTYISDILKKLTVVGI